ncbi:MAG: TatD family hydrolase, partial [Planctomycetota bacterium]
MIDVHCHLDLYPDPGAVAREVVKNGVFVVSVTTTPAAWSGTKKLAAGHESIVTALGMHPQLVATRAKDMEQFEGLIPQASWLGEVGLDGSPESCESLPQQTDVFRRVLRASERA